MRQNSVKFHTYFTELGKNVPKRCLHACTFFHLRDGDDTDYKYENDDNNKIPADRPCSSEEGGHVGGVDGHGEQGEEPPAGEELAAGQTPGHRIQTRNLQKIPLVLSIKNTTLEGSL